MPNLVVNGDFSNGVVGWLDGGSTALTTDTTTYGAASPSCKVTRSNTSKNWSGIYQEIPIAEGHQKTFKFSCSLKNASGQIVYWWVGFYDKDLVYLDQYNIYWTHIGGKSVPVPGYIDSTGNWQRVVGFFEIPPEARQMELGFYFTDLVPIGSYFNIDDIEVEIAPTADRLKALLEPMFYNDDGYPLNIYLSSLADLLQPVDDWASDTDDGKPGYSILVDPTRCPVEVLPWLAQFVGARIWAGLTESQQREQLVGLGNWKRGTVAAMQAAVQPLLTGGQTVQIKERDTSPYHFQALTLASETPNQTQVIAALLSQKPAGLQMTYVYFSGQKAFTIGGSALRGTVPDALRLVV